MAHQPVETLTMLATQVARLESVVSEQAKTVSRLIKLFAQTQKRCDQRHSVLDSQITKLREFDAFCRGRTELSASTYVRIGLLIALFSAISTFGRYFLLRQ